MGGNSRAALRRAARHADGWVPWELTAEECTTALAYAREIRAAAARPEAFEVVVPLAIGRETGADEVLASAAAWRTAGATAFHVGIAADGFGELLERIDWFGREVISRTP